MSGFSSFETGGTYSNSACTLKALNNFPLPIQNLEYEAGKLVTINKQHAATLLDL